VLISIPRDLYINELGVSGKINTAYTKSGEVLKQTVSRVTGLPISNYLAIDFVGFQRAIHHIGGIEVEVTEELDDPWYPIMGEELNPCDYTPEEIAEMTNTMSGFELEKQFECRYEHLHVEPGLVSMEGGEALKFVRSRHSSSDFSRSKRAQQVITGIVNKLIILDTQDDISGFFEEISEHIRTDIDVELLTQLTPLLKSIPQLTITTVNLSTENVLNTAGANLIPKAGEGSWHELHDYIEQQLATD
jgi:anionic cell wall polymer biosynthesis LytR-Cps2A-Psr (LCP) family protein